MIVFQSLLTEAAKLPAIDQKSAAGMSSPGGEETGEGELNCSSGRQPALIKMRCCRRASTALPLGYSVILSKTLRLRVSAVQKNTILRNEPIFRHKCLSIKTIHIGEFSSIKVNQGSPRSTLAIQALRRWFSQVKSGQGKSRLVQPSPAVLENKIVFSGEANAKPHETLSKKSSLTETITGLMFQRAREEYLSVV